MSATEEAAEATCVHCGVRILRVSLGFESLWVHVPSEGPVYLLVQCSLVAAPAAADAAPVVPVVDRDGFIESAEAFYDRSAGPGEEWTFADLFDFLAEQGRLELRATVVAEQQEKDAKIAEDTGVARGELGEYESPQLRAVRIARAIRAGGLQ